MSTLSATPTARRARRGAEGPGREAAILAALEDDAPTVRERAVRLAARYVEPQCSGRAGRRRGQRDPAQSAVSALERQGPYAVPHLIDCSAPPEVDVVMFALQVLARIGDPLAFRAILPLLGHADPNVAQSAIEALGRMRHRRAVPALLDLLQRRSLAPARRHERARRDRRPRGGRPAARPGPRFHRRRAGGPRAAAYRRARVAGAAARAGSCRTGASAPRRPVAGVRRGDRPAPGPGPGRPLVPRGDRAGPAAGDLRLSRGAHGVEL